MKERKIIKEKNQGITLIALIITIIILLILSSVSIGVIIKGDFFNKAQDTVGKANSGTENKKNQEENVKNVWDALPGKIIKSGTSEKSTIEIMVTTSNVTRTSFRVHAKGTNKNGDILTFVLKVGETIYTEQTGEEVSWDVTGLTPNTKYQFEVIARDARTENSVMGEETTLSNQKPELTIGASNVAATTATITATGTDGDGDTLTYVLKINGTQYGEIKTGTSGTEVSWDITNLSETTTYTYTVEVSDSYDTITKSATFTTGSSNTAPVIKNNYNYSTTSQTTSFTIRMKATDNEGDNLTYELFYSTSENGTYTSSGTSTVTAGTYTTIKQENLTTYTPYWWYITVTDGKEKVTSGKQTLNTYCSGKGNTCTNTTMCGNKVYCTTCNASGNSYYAGEVECPNGSNGSHWSVSEYNLVTKGKMGYCTCTADSAGDYGCCYTATATCGLCGHTDTVGYCTGCSGTYTTDTHWTDCEDCEYAGWNWSASSSCTHNRSSIHYYCTNHDSEYVGSSSSHTYCSHGRISAHND